MNSKNIIFICIILCTTLTSCTAPDKKASSPYIIYQTPQAMWQQHQKQTALGSFLSTLGVAFLVRGSSSADIAQRISCANQYDQKTRNIDANIFNLMSNVGYVTGGVCLISGLSILLYTYIYTNTAAEKETNDHSNMVKTTPRNTQISFNKGIAPEKLLKK